MSPVPNLELSKVLGSGSFGNLFSLLGYVFEAYDHDWSCKVALKRTTKAGEYVSREYEILEMLKDCKNCVKVLDIFYTKTDEGKMA